MPVKFQVSTRQSGRLRTIQVVVYDNLTKLRKACVRFAVKHQGHKKDHATNYFANADGCAHCWNGGRVGKNGELYPSPPAGIIRLYQGFLGAAVVAHEVVHMAVAIYHHDCADDKGPINQEMENEEILCYLVSDLVDKINSKLWKLGCYGTQGEIMWGPYGDDG